MSLIDRTILEWAWMSEKGYPDINNENDLRVFESLFGFDLNEGDFKTLSFGDLRKYGGPRLKELHRHIEEKIPVTLANDEEETIEYADPDSVSYTHLTLPTTPYV